MTTLFYPPPPPCFFNQEDWSAQSPTLHIEHKVHSWFLCSQYASLPAVVSRASASVHGSQQQAVTHFMAVYAGMELDDPRLTDRQTERHGRSALKSHIVLLPITPHSCHSRRLVIEAHCGSGKCRWFSSINALYPSTVPGQLTAQLETFVPHNPPRRHDFPPLT